MKSLSSKARVTLGLVGLTVSAVLMAAMLDLVPDRIGAAREGRATLAEVLASSSSGWVDANNIGRAEDTVRLAVERNPDLLSAAMRRIDGTPVLLVGEHEGQWRPMLGEHSSDAQIRVPILSGERRWGELELRFRPLLGGGPMALLGHPLVLLVAFLATACFFSFYFYLSKALAQLDPGKAVPGRVRSALDTMAEGLLVIDRSGRIVLANRAFSAMVDRPGEVLVGTQPTDLAFEGAEGESGAALRFPWIRALETGEEEYGIPMRLRDGEGRQRALMVNCSPVMGASGRPGGVLVSFDDVTELEARGEQLREAKDEADQANRAKSEFLANMSHEIRTPMNAILGFTDVLRRGRTSDEREARRYLNTIHSSGTHLLDLINDILDLSKVESGHMEVERAPVAPHRVVQEVLTVLSVKAGEKDIELEYQPLGKTPETVVSDAARLRQIITNLVGNAIKFTETGSVRVTSHLDEGPEGPVIEIQVQDSGIGIPADKLDSVFEAFAQADSSVTRRFGGTGLGLPISRKFARAMGGDITVASAPGEGSTFMLRLPTGVLDGVTMLAPEEVLQASDEVAEAEDRAWSFAGARVLVVDDAPENRSLLEVVLADSGLVLAQAENGLVALERIAREDFDLVLMDMQMPVMDGYTATRRLREQGFTAPIIALTAHAMQGYEQECRAVGCNDFVTKPIDIDGLVEVMARWLPQHAREIAPAPAGGPTLVAGAEAAPLVSTLLDAMPDNARVQQALRGFTVDLHDRLVLMRKACEEGDLVTLERLAHWLKGSAGSLGFAAFTEPARALHGHARSGDRDGALVSLGVVEALAARVRMAGDGGPGPATSTVSPAPAAAQPAAPEGGDAVAGPLTSALAGNPRMHAVIRLFSERLEQRLGALSGDESLEELAEMAHWLKGSAGTVGFTDFTEPARELEERSRAGDAPGAARALDALHALAARIVVPADTAPAQAG